LIVAQYTNGASAVNVDSVVDTAKALVKKEADNYGWSEWVKVEIKRNTMPAKD